MKGNATHLENVVIDDTEAPEHKEEYEKRWLTWQGRLENFAQKIILHNG